MDAAYDVLAAVDSIRSSLAVRYRPREGMGCYGVRRKVDTPVQGLPSAYVPVTMLDDPGYLKVVCDSDG